MELELADLHDMTVEQAIDKPCNVASDDDVTNTESAFSMLSRATAQVLPCNRLLTILACYEFDQLQTAPTPMVQDVKLSRGNCPITDSDKARMDQYPF